MRIFCKWNPLPTDTCLYCKKQYLCDDTKEHQNGCLEFVKFKLSKLEVELSACRRGEDVINDLHIPALNKCSLTRKIVSKIKAASKTSFDTTGRENIYGFDWYTTYSEKVEIVGCKIGIFHNRCLGFDKKKILNIEYIFPQWIIFLVPNQNSFNE